ncbi:MAG: divergent polysaccharide deacetylase family protein [Acidobacteria bacterium]|nr:divergent polysaccharide deacetylase family protein [Acidobacteriota bacterium]
MAAKSKRRTKRKTKGGFRFAWILSGMVLLAGLVGLFVLVGKFRSFPDKRMVASIDAMLIGANVDIDKAVEKTVDEHGVHHWKIRVANEQIHARLVRALEQWCTGQGGYLEKGKPQQIRGVTHHLVSLVFGANRMNLVFVIEAQAPQRKPTSPAPTKVPEPVAQAEQTSSPLEEPSPKVAIILDDIGHHPPSSLSPVLDLKFPITFAVLPFLAHSNQAATYLHQTHYQVMLHMPMEPDNFPKTNPGPGAIYAHLNRAEILEALAKALGDVPYVVGVNNHMGSKITANRTLMEIVLADLKRRDLFFIDSRTHTTTVAFETAQRLGVRSAERQVFLDSEESLEFTLGQMEEVKRRALQGESIIAIGHPYPSTLKALVQTMPALDREGIQFVFASELVSKTVANN